MIAAGCKANVIEVHLSVPEMQGWQHNACTIAVAEGAELTHSVLHLLPDTEHLVQTRRQRLNIAPKGAYKGALATFGGGLVRSEIHTTLTADCRYTLVSLSCPRLAQHHDVTLKTLHTGERNTVNIRQRNLQADASHAVFQGKFEVLQAAQKTDAYMHCHTLLLSDEARTSTKPELEIYADDVKCSHGAACGGLNPAQLFYLQARGLPEVAARALLVQGFADEFVHLFPTDVQPVLAERVGLWLAGDGPHAPILTDFSEEWLANTKASPEERTVVRAFGDEQTMGTKNQ
jgi:Fe-S cluster assembly protein SufD